MFKYLVVSNLGWDLMEPPQPAAKRATIEFYLPKEKGLLPQPYGSYRVTGSTIYELEQKADGITRIIDGASLIQYDIYYNPVLGRDSDKPTHRNRAVHPEEDKYLAKVVENWQVEGLLPEERVNVIKNYFENGFSYTLDILEQNGNESPLKNFLLQSRAGYCEQFATATTLLLRKVGVPSRYVTGYVVTEKSEFEQKFIVRERHAHSWSEAYINDRWVTVDNTPADWFARESESRSQFEGLKDLFSYFKLRYDHFRIRTEQNYNQVLSIIIVILAIILIYRIYSRMNAARQIAGEGSGKGKKFDIVDSPLYLVEKRLQDLQIPRRSEESFLQWAGRIHATRNIEFPMIEGMFRLHLKLRFDPGGLDVQEQQRMTDQANVWLEACKCWDNPERKD
jgi:transglutaminase-like putative cysteine protease